VSPVHGCFDIAVGSDAIRTDHDRVDLAFKYPVGISINPDAHGLSDLELAAVLLRHREVGVELRQIGQRHDLRARGEVLADFNMPDAEFAIKRRAHQLLRNDRLCPRNPSVGLIVGRLRLIDGRLRTELARGELLGAVER